MNTRWRESLRRFLAGTPTSSARSTTEIYSPRFDPIRASFCYPFCSFAAFILSTRFGYRRPARFAEAFALALLFAVSFVWPEPLGAGFFQGSSDDRGIIIRERSEPDRQSYFKKPHRPRRKSWLSGEYRCMFS